MKDGKAVGPEDTTVEDWKCAIAAEVLPMEKRFLQTQESCKFVATKEELS